MTRYAHRWMVLMDVGITFSLSCIKHEWMEQNHAWNPKKASVDHIDVMLYVESTKEFALPKPRLCLTRPPRGVCDVSHCAKSIMSTTRGAVAEKESSLNECCVWMCALQMSENAHVQCGAHFCVSKTLGNISFQYWGVLWTCFPSSRTPLIPKQL